MLQIWLGTSSEIWCGIISYLQWNLWSFLIVNWWRILHSNHHCVGITELLWRWIVIFKNHIVTSRGSLQLSNPTKTSWTNEAACLTACCQSVLHNYFMFQSAEAILRTEVVGREVAWEKDSIWYNVGNVKLSLMQLFCFRHDNKLISHVWLGKVRNQ